MTGVDRVEESRRLESAEFAENDPIGAQTQGCLEEMVCRAFRAFLARSQKADRVALPRSEFEGILDGDDPLIIVDEIEQPPPEFCLARRGAS